MRCRVAVAVGVLVRGHVSVVGERAGGRAERSTMQLGWTKMIYAAQSAGKVWNTRANVRQLSAGAESRDQEQKIDCGGPLSGRS